jgi:phosphonopyruvate decarboxylase
MEAQDFLDVLTDLGAAFYTGVPDSLLNPFGDCLMERHGIGEKHIVAANEGAAVALAAGHYLATNRPAVVYMQNSGLGNAVNPICSLLHETVYAIPVIFVIGWRGEPGTKDEPQHGFQGQVTLPLLDCLEIPYQVLGETGAVDVETFRQHLQAGQAVAFVIRKGALTHGNSMAYSTPAALSREEALKTILSYGKEDVYVCTTGKLSREVFELRELASGGHEHDFLTVGSMGHSLMIAHGIAIARPAKRVWCLDGDGAALMHMGSLAVVGVHRPPNLVHVVINNGAHESVGGQPAVSKHLKLSELAQAVGYQNVYHAANRAGLIDIMDKVGNGRVDITDNVDSGRVDITNSHRAGPVFIEVMCNLDSRADLGRPTVAPLENKRAFMSFLAGEDK